MALRRSRGRDSGRTKGIAELIASTTKPEPSGGTAAQASAVLTPGLTRYQRQSANLPSGAKPMTVAELTNIVVDLRDADDADEEGDA